MVVQRPAATMDPNAPSPSEVVTVVVGSDHGGFARKEELKAYINSLGKKIEIVDMGCHDESRCDYPDIAQAVAAKYAEKMGGVDASWTADSASKVFGLLVCGSGLGIGIAANKWLAGKTKLGRDSVSTSAEGATWKTAAGGACCSTVADVTTARYARRQMRTNFISIGGRNVGLRTAQEILDVWLVE